MRDAASLLLSLAQAAETVLTRPVLGGIHRLVELREEIEAVHAAPPPEGGPLIDVEAVLLAQVLVLAEKMRAQRDEERARLLQQLAGVLLPAVRQAGAHAIAVRRDTRPTP